MSEFNSVLESRLALFQSRWGHELNLSDCHRIYVVKIVLPGTILAELAPLLPVFGAHPSIMGMGTNDCGAMVSGLSQDRQT